MASALNEWRNQQAGGALKKKDAKKKDDGGLFGTGLSLGTAAAPLKAVASGSKEVVGGALKVLDYTTRPLKATSDLVFYDHVGRLFPGSGGYKDNKRSFKDWMKHGGGFAEISRQVGMVRDLEKNKYTRPLVYAGNFVGELGTDPLSYVPGVGLGSAATKAGRAAKVTEEALRVASKADTALTGSAAASKFLAKSAAKPAPKMVDLTDASKAARAAARPAAKGGVRTQGRNELAKILDDAGFKNSAELAASRQRHLIPEEVLRAVGLQRGVHVSGVGTVGGKRTAEAVRQIEKLSPGRVVNAGREAALKSGKFDNVFQFMGDRTGGALKAERAYGKVARIQHENDASIARHVGKAESAKALRDWSRNYMSEKGVLRKLDQRAVIDYLEGVATPEQVAKIAPHMSTVDKLRPLYADAYKRLNDMSGGTLPKVDRYVPRTLSREAADAMRRASEVDKRWIQAMPEKVGPRMRRYKAGETFMGKVLQTGSTSEMNDIFRRVSGKNFDLFDYDIPRGISEYADYLGTAAAQREMGTRLVRRGFGRPDEYVTNPSFAPETARLRAILDPQLEARAAAQRRLDGLLTRGQGKAAKDAARAEAARLKTEAKAMRAEAASAMPERPLVNVAPTAERAVNDVMGATPPPTWPSTPPPSGPVNVPPAAQDAANRAVGKVAASVPKPVDAVFSQYRGVVGDDVELGVPLTKLFPKAKTAAQRKKIADRLLAAQADLTVDGFKMTLPASTGTKGGKGLFRTVGPDGEPITLYAIRFTRERVDEAASNLRPEQVVDAAQDVKAMGPHPYVAPSTVNNPAPGVVRSNLPAGPRPADSGSKVFSTDRPVAGPSNADRLRQLADEAVAAAAAQTRNAKTISERVAADAEERRVLREFLAQSKRSTRQVEKDLKSLKPQEWVSVLEGNLRQYGWLDGNKLLLQPEMRDVMRGMDELRSKGPGAFWRQFDAITSAWKGFQLLTPGFHIRNYWGGMFNNWLAGVDASLYRKVEKNMRRYLDGGAVAVPDRRLAEAIDVGVRMGVGGTGDSQLAELVSMGLKPGGIKADAPLWRRSLHQMDPTSADFKPFQVNRRVGDKVEDNLRMTLFVDSMLKGMPADQAFQRVMRFHGDQMALSAGERGVMRRIFPFYGFTKWNFPLQMELLAQQPGRYFAFYNLQNAAFDTMPEDPERPAWIRDVNVLRAPVDFGGNPTYLQPDLMFRDLVRPGDEGMNYLYGSTNPLIQQLFQQLTGQQLGRDYPLAAMEPKPATGMTGAVARLLGVADDGEIQRATYETLRRALPFLKYDKIVDGNPNRRFEGRMSILGGMTTRVDDGADASDTVPNRPTPAQRNQRKGQPAPAVKVQGRAASNLAKWRAGQ